MKRTGKGGRASLIDVLDGPGPSAATDRVLARSFWVPASSTTPSPPIDLARARIRR